MKATALIERARSLSDTPNSEFISHQDEEQSLNESWKDIYSQIIKSSEDYFIQEAIVDTTNNKQLGPNEWEITIPVDVYRLRFVDYKTNGRWESMRKFNTNNRNRVYGSPQYRWRGNKLWVIASFLPGEIRLDYYPPPQVITVPEFSFNYLMDTPVYTKSTEISSPQYFSIPNPNLSDNTDYLLYVLDGTRIMLESTTLNTTSTLYTSTGISNVVYNTGFIYWLEEGDICRSTTTLTGTLIKDVLVTPDILSFNISSGKLYYTTGLDTYESLLDGTLPTLYLDDEAEYITHIGPDTYHLTNGSIFRNGVDQNIDAQSLTTDGTSLYYLDTIGDLYKGEEVFTTSLVFAGQIQDSYISTIDVNYNIKAISTIDDTDLIYPINEANEMMAYQCAIDFKRKQAGDVTELSIRLGQIQDRFISTLIRDDNEPERRGLEQQLNYYY